MKKKTRCEKRSEVEDEEESIEEIEPEPTAKIDRTLLPVRKKREKFGVAHLKFFLYWRQDPGGSSKQVPASSHCHRRGYEWEVRGNIFFSWLL